MTKARLYMLFVLLLMVGVLQAQNHDWPIDLWTDVVTEQPEGYDLTSIEEQCENVNAIAYPNPGKDVLNIRTGLRNAWVEVYDVNGRLVHRQAITEDVMGIDAGEWAEGVYVWKVMANGKLVET